MAAARDCKVLRFEGKGAVLGGGSFKDVAQQVVPLVMAMREEFERQRQAQADQEQAEEERAAEDEPEDDDMVGDDTEV